MWRVTVGFYIRTDCRRTLELIYLCIVLLAFWASQRFYAFLQKYLDITVQWMCGPLTIYGTQERPQGERQMNVASYKEVACKGRFTYTMPFPCHAVPLRV
jgi:hypothetical protein